MKHKPNKQCLQCGNKFFRHKSHPNFERANFCNRKCFALYRKLTHNVECTCLGCSNKFSMKPSQVKEGRGKYCSLKCFFKYSSFHKGTPWKERFWTNIEKTDSCWLWTGSKRASGYGRMYVPERGIQLAHRLSWEVHNGPIPDDLCVLHNCPGGDNRACVNPKHLWLGTRDDNNKDCSRKNRNCHGESHPCAKVTDEQILSMFTLKESGLSIAAISRIFKLRETTVSCYLSGKTRTECFNKFHKINQHKQQHVG